MTFDDMSDFNEDTQDWVDQPESGEKFRWPSKAVKLLLNLRFGMENEFLHSTGKKIRLWDVISEKMKKENYNVSGPLCFSKYRNLTATYRRRKEMGPSYCRWEHFELMDSHLGSQSENILEQTYETSSEQTYEADSQKPTIYIIEQIDGEELVHSEENSSNFQWTIPAVTLLLNLRFQLKREFSSKSLNYGRKSELWESISKVMQQHNYNVTGYMCDCKYRNLLSTYRKNKEKMGVTGDSHCPWVHFDLMDKHLGHGSTVEETEESNYASHSALNNDLVQEVEEVVKNSKGVVHYQWAPDAIRLLLNLRFEKDEDFQNPHSKKAMLWDEISKRMQNEDYHVTGHMCYSKYRTLLHTYRRVKEKQVRTGYAFTRWEFFELMDSHISYLEDKPASKSSTKDLGLSDLIEVTQSEVEDEDDDYDGVDGDNGESEAETTVGSKRKLSKFSISDYLQYKLRADEKKRQDYVVLEEKRLRLEEKRLELEQKKIEVLQTLVTALKKRQT
ncbi:hypothetical protein M8J75_014621 [Diaphorina citri]|nr:hypothetical protein M8J75_014621 [Diaphorina citri]